jgi:hypothetical protein
MGVALALSIGLAGMIYGIHHEYRVAKNNQRKLGMLVLGFILIVLTVSGYIWLSRFIGIRWES